MVLLASILLAICWSGTEKVVKHISTSLNTLMMLIMIMLTLVPLRTRLVTMSRPMKLGVSVFTLSLNITKSIWRVASKPLQTKALNSTTLSVFSSMDMDQSDISLMRKEVAFKLGKA